MPASSGLTLHTERLTLRHLSERDAPALAALMDAEISRWLASWGFPCSTDDAMEKIRLLRGTADRNAALPLAITERGAGAVMGMVSFVRCEQALSRAEVSYWLGRCFHGNGYMREALAAALPLAFEVLHVDVIEGGGQPANGSSFAVMQSLGFRRISDRVVYALNRQREETCHYYELARRAVQ